MSKYVLIALLSCSVVVASQNPKPGFPNIYAQPPSSGAPFSPHSYNNNQAPKSGLDALVNAMQENAKKNYGGGSSHNSYYGGYNGGGSGLSHNQLDGCTIL